MVSTLVLALVAVVGLCSAAPNHVIPDVDPVIINYDIDDHARVDSAAARIVGGTATTVNEYPWIVQMEFYTGIWNQACAANILNAIYVLSAAQCTHTFIDPFYRIENRRIRAGTTERNTGGIIRELMWVEIAPGYMPPSYGYDISLIRLSQPLALGPTIQSIPIAPQGYNLPDNLPVVHAGWGANSTGGSFSDVLHHVTVNSINADLCFERILTMVPYPPFTDGIICTGILNEGGRGSCDGDTGGPLYYGRTLVGVISWVAGPYCGDSYYPRVNTKLSQFTDWIISHAN